MFLRYVRHDVFCVTLDARTKCLMFQGVFHMRCIFERLNHHLNRYHASPWTEEANEFVGFALEVRFTKAVFG